MLIFLKNLPSSLQGLKQITYQSLILPVIDRHCFDEHVHLSFILAPDLYENPMKKIEKGGLRFSCLFCCCCPCEIITISIFFKSYKNETVQISFVWCS